MTSCEDQVKPYFTDLPPLLTEILNNIGNKPKTSEK